MLELIIAWLWVSIGAGMFNDFKTWNKTKSNGDTKYYWIQYPLIVILGPIAFPAIVTKVIMELSKEWLDTNELDV